MARWASFIDGKRAGNPVLLLDTGDFCREKKSEMDDLEYPYFFEGMKLMKYDAAGVAPNEIRFGRTQLMKAAADYGLPLVSSNIIDRRGEGTVGAKWIIKEIGGRKTVFGRKGALRVGIFTVVLPGFIHAIDPLIPKYYTVPDPKSAALEAVAELKAEGCGLIVALSFQGWDKSLEFAHSTPGIDIVINGKRSHEGTHGEWADSTFVVDTGVGRVSFTEVEIAFREGGRSIRATDVGGAVRAAEERADLADLEKRYQKELEDRKKGL